MRQRAPVDLPVALTIAGSDSGGGAGIQADLQTMAAHDVFGTSAVTAVTAQHTRGVEATEVLPAEHVRAQVEAVASDLEVGALKTGMLATTEIVETVAECVRNLDAPVVVDPVMVAASGDRLLEPEAEDAYEALIAEAAVVTPNADETAVLADVEAVDVESARSAGEAIRDLGADAALVKGGHVDVDGDVVRDVLVTGDGSSTVDSSTTGDGATMLEHPRVDTDATHGSGCALSAAIAARLARGAAIEPAVEGATSYLAQAVRYGFEVGEGPGAVNHLVGLRDRAAREPTAEAVHDVVDALVDADARELVPEVGTNVAGTTPHAETETDVAAVEGRITRTTRGIRPNRGVRFGASSHVARILLAAREFGPDVRFACNCRFDDDVDAALAELGWTVAEFDRSEQPDDVAEPEGSTMDWGTERALEDAEETPAAIVDRGAVGKEPMCRLLAPDASTLADRALALLDAVRE